MATTINDDVEETLLVACVHCRRSFATPMQVDRTTLEALVLTEAYECSHCGTTAVYRKSDHYFELQLDRETRERRPTDR